MNKIRKSVIMMMFATILIMSGLLILATGCSSSFESDTNYNIDEEIGMPKVVFIYDDSKMSKKEQPVLASLRKKYEDKVKFYFIDAKKTEAKALLEKHSVEYFPQTWLIFKDGIIKKMYQGFTASYKESIEKDILEIIKGDSTPKFEGSSVKLKGEWEVTKTESKTDDIYALAYKTIISVGDTIRFIDGKTVKIAAFPFEYEVTEDNVIKLMREGSTSMIFDYEIKGKDTLIFENEYIRVESSKVK